MIHDLKKERKKEPAERDMKHKNAPGTTFDLQIASLPGHSLFVVITDDCEKDTLTSTLELCFVLAFSTSKHWKAV